MANRDHLAGLSGFVNGIGNGVRICCSQGTPGAHFRIKMVSCADHHGRVAASDLPIDPISHAFPSSTTVPALKYGTLIARGSFAHRGGG